MNSKKSSGLPGSDKFYIGYEKKEVPTDSNRLKDKFIETIKKYEKKNHRSSNVSLSPKARHPNLVILSKAE